MKLVSALNGLFPEGSSRRKFLISGYRGADRALTCLKSMRRRTKTQRSVMTLLVRDEADIIAQNIEFHLCNGVDFIVATDNGSDDGTRTILAEYEKKGVLHLIDRAEQNHSQARWVNDMGRIAREKYGATIIFHCDADEFWYPVEGDLKTEIAGTSGDCLSVNVVNVLLEDRAGMERFPRDARYAVIHPLASKCLEEDSKKQNMYFFRYPSKVIFKSKRKLFVVGEGNHYIKDAAFRDARLSEDIIIYHFPVRGKTQFISKVINGGSALGANTELGQEIGWHWRRWYRSYLDGTLGEEYKKLTLSSQNAGQMIQAGMIEVFDFEKFSRKKSCGTEEAFCRDDRE